ncbi:hypothetical protein KII05_11210, partial [Weissella confusa]|uniref:hypothetical protein n=1 Tax=Weissella confusa TaxID=1583 RepID=UPI001BCF2B8B
YSQHGANRLGANSLLSAIYGGSVAGPNAVKYIKGLKKHSEDLPEEIYSRREKEEQDKWEAILKMDGTENAYLLHKELGEWMTDNMTVVRVNSKLEETYAKLTELQEGWEKININDTQKWSNQGAHFT